MKIFQFFLIFFFVQLIIPAQTESNPFQKGSWELNFTGSLGSIESSVEYSSSYVNGESSESQKYFELGIIPAWYLTEGLSIEPEVNMFLIEKSEPALSLLGNLSYTLKIKNSNVYPFVRAGYGITNSFQFPVNRSLTRVSNNLDVGVLNLGGGIKVPLSDRVLLRTELNYRRFSYSIAESSYYFKGDYTVSSIAVLFGFSILL